MLISFEYVENLQKELRDLKKEMEAVRRELGRGEAAPRAEAIAGLATTPPPPQHGANTKEE